MATKDEHLQGARENTEFIRWRLDSRVAVDRPWMVTAMFYTALHLVDAYFATQGKDPANHHQRNTWIANDPTLDPIWLDYKYLYDRSRDARYGLLPFSEAEVQEMQTQRLDQIGRHIYALLVRVP